MVGFVLFALSGVLVGCRTDPILESDITRRVDFALFMVEALENDELIHEAPAIVGCQTPSALAHKKVS
jgi:hypothetical protein